MSEEIKKEDNKIKSFFKKIGSTILNWLKSGFKWICVAFIALISMILFKKIDHKVQLNDEKKKQNAKNDASETKDNINKAENIAENIKSDIKIIEENVSNDKKKLEKSKKDYKEKQEKLAEEAGFTKDK